MLERVKSAKKLNAIIVATTEKPEDDMTTQIATRAGVGVFRGSERDVLDRFYQTAKEARADVVMRLTGDCPLIDPKVIDEVADRFFERGFDYASTPANYPEGLDTEIFSFAALERAWREAALPSEREHVTLYIKNHPELFKIDESWRSGTADHASMHWSVDTPTDFVFVTEVFERLYPANPSFSKDDILALLARHPELLEINKDGTGYEGLDKSLKEDDEFKKHHA